MSLFDPDDCDEDHFQELIMLIGVTLQNMCKQCRGKGKYDMNSCHGFGQHRYRWVFCYDCDGTGIQKETVDEQVDSRRETD